MKALGSNPKKLARDAGTNENYVYDILSGKTVSPTEAGLRKLARVLGCSIQDLTEEMERPEDEVPEHEGTSHAVPKLARAASRALAKTSDTIGIDELDVRASAGAGALHEVEQVRATWQLPRDLLRSYSSSPAEHIKIATIIGDSMEPTLMAATKVMIDTQDKRPSPPGIFYVWDGVGLVCKRVEIVPGTDPLRVRLISDNTRYTAYEINLEDAQIQGRVMGRWQWL